mmetsp:Transcript_3693/g.7905  ORF Transcript_3693/g.7905 Transcript_3693/m.7905 type:complete len:251 (+) Transcript_3693:595-1347(+)
MRPIGLCALATPWRSFRHGQHIRGPLRVCVRLVLRDAPLAYGEARSVQLRGKLPRARLEGAVGALLPQGGRPDERPLAAQVPRPDVGAGAPAEEPEYERGPQHGMHLPPRPLSAAEQRVGHCPLPQAPASARVRRRRAPLPAVGAAAAEYDAAVLHAHGLAAVEAFAAAACLGMLRAARLLALTSRPSAARPLLETRAPPARWRRAWCPGLQGPHARTRRALVRLRAATGPTIHDSRALRFRVKGARRSV